MELSDRYSILMSVSGRETPAFLKDSMMSLYEQTLPADDFVLIENGPVPTALNAILKRMKTLYKNRLRVIALREYTSAGEALTAGLEECRHDLVALMESGAFAAPGRCERQVRVFDTRRVDLVGTALGIYGEDPENVIEVRYQPEDAVSITKMSRRSNPFHQTTVMLKKDKALEAGGFTGVFPQMSDYHLWVRMLMSGCSGYNIPERLVFMRAESAEKKSRITVEEQLAFEKWKRDAGWTKLSDYIRSTLNMRFSRKK